MGRDVRWIDTDGRQRLAVQPRPPAERLLPFFTQLEEAGVSVVVSMLTPPEAEGLGLAGEADACARAGLRFLSFPIPDHTAPPDRAEAERFAAAVLDAVEPGGGAVLHCYAGVGRSATIAILALRALGYGLDDAIDRVREARGLPVPEGRQLRWLYDTEVQPTRG